MEASHWWQRWSTPVSSTKPFSFEHATEIKSSMDRKMKRPVKTPDNNDGKQPLRKYLMHFERCAIINGWLE